MMSIIIGIPGKEKSGGGHLGSQSFFFLLMFENDVETASSFSLNDGVLTLQMHSPILSFSFLNPYFSIFSSALFGFQESGVGLIWIVSSFYVLIAKKMKEKEVKFLIYVWFFF